MKPDQERVKNLLTDTVTLLCKNGLFFNDELRIEGLLGVTIDSKDAFFVHISEQFGSGAEHNDGNIIANVLSSKDSSKFLSERRKSHRTDDSPQRSRDSARSTPTRPLSQQSSHSPGIREPRSEKRKSLDTPPGVRVKKERYDDDLMLIDSKRRVPLPHGPLSQDDAEAMRQSYGIDANSLGQIQQVQVTHQLGEVKRQSASHLVDAGGGTFVTSMVRQESGATNSPTGNPWPDLAAQVSGGVTQPCDSQMTLDSLPGSSQWSPAQSASQLAATTQPPSASDMFRGRFESMVDIRTRRPREAEGKSYICEEPGCGKKFYHGYNLYRHQRLKHGASLKQKHFPASPSTASTWACTSNIWSPPSDSSSQEMLTKTLDQTHVGSSALNPHSLQKDDTKVHLPQPGESFTRSKPQLPGTENPSVIIPPLAQYTNEDETSDLEPGEIRRHPITREQIQLIGTDNSK